MSFDGQRSGSLTREGQCRDTINDRGQNDLANDSQKTNSPVEKFGGHNGESRKAQNSVATKTSSEVRSVFPEKSGRTLNSSEPSSEVRGGSPKNLGHTVNSSESNPANVEDASQIPERASRITPRLGGIGSDEVGAMMAVPERSVTSLPHLVATIRETYRQIEDLQRAEIRLTLQIKAICRRLCGGDKNDADRLYNTVIRKRGAQHEHAATAEAIVIHFIAARDALESPKNALKKQIEKLAKKLPVADFVERTRGFSWGSLAAIVGAAGNLSDYPKHDRLWKRMGLACMEDGTRQRKVAGDAAIEHGYSPARRSIMWNVGDPQIRNRGRYRAIYDARKAYEMERSPEMTPGHAHNRAKRYMEKKLLRDLWQEWRRCCA